MDLRDEQGKSVPVGHPGELYVRSRTVMKCYWNDSESTAEVLDDSGWFRTGDVARQDEGGNLYLIDRMRDIIVTGRTADNVYSRLLDDFLGAYPGVKEAATIGITTEDRIENVHVVLVPRDRNEVPEFSQLSRDIVEALGNLYAPASYSVAESLPRTAVGKIDKKALREGMSRR